MKTVYTLLCLLFVACGYGQTNNTLKVTYANFYLNKRQDGYSTLTAFNNKSLFETKAKFKFSTEITTNTSMKVKEGVGEMESYIFNYVDFNIRHSIANEYVGTLANKYLVTDTVDIVWHFTNEKKSIEKFTCFKAVTDFKGRKYVAWYNSEIPLPLGPWKLIDLPGLVMEVNEIGNPLVTKAIKIEWLQNVKEIDVPVNNFREISWKAYKQLWINWRNKMQKSLNTSADPSISFEGKIDIDLPEKSIFQQ